MNLRNLTFILSAFLFLCTLNIKAQVTIGADQEPHVGAVLELVSNQTRGLLLPKVNLNSASVWGLGGAATDGMMVYNENPSTTNNLKGKGVYVWTDSQWKTTTTDPCSGNLTIGNILPSQSSFTKNTLIHFSVVPVSGAISYVWTITSPSPADLTIIRNSSGPDCYLAVLATGNFILNVTAYNACGSSVSQNKYIVID